MPMGIGDRISEAREAKGWRQRQLGAAIDVDGSQVSRWENGHVTPSGRLLAAIADALGCSVSYLLTGQRDA